MTDRLKLASDEKSTVHGKDFHTFITFQQRSYYDLCYHNSTYIVCRHVLWFGKRI